MTPANAANLKRQYGEFVVRPSSGTLDLGFRQDVEPPPEGRTATSPSSRSLLSRMIYGGLGWCAVALAFAGVFVPGLPVTVFVLIASWCFARSSPRFESYLLTNRWFGSRLRRFREFGGMPRTAKIAAIASMWTAIAISSAVLASVSMVGSLVTILLGGIGTLTIMLAVRTVGE